MSLTIPPASKPSRSKIITGLCLSTLVLAACQSPTASSPEQTVTTEFYAFSAEPTHNDIPVVELNEPVLTDVEDHYFRYLGVRGSAEFYMARTDHEDTVAQGLCFIAVDTEIGEATTTCKGPDELDPMVLQLDTPVEAFLIPDNTQVDDLPEGWSQARRNVIVVTEPDVAPTEAEVMFPNYSGGLPEAFTLQRN